MNRWIHNCTYQRFSHEVYLDRWHRFWFLERLLGAEDGCLVLDDVHLDDCAAPPAAPGAADTVPSAEWRPPALHDEELTRSLTSRLLSLGDHGCADILTLTPVKEKTFLNLRLTTRSHWSGRSVRDFSFNDFPELSRDNLKSQHSVCGHSLDYIGTICFP